MKSYGQFCPVSKATEILEERWTLLIIREMISGCRHFNELQHGLPHISRSVLAERLRSLERAGIIERRADVNGTRTEYILTPAGEDLTDVIIRIGEWGQRWVNQDVTPDEIDARLLMWDMHRRIHLDRLPEDRVVVQFDFSGASREHIWLVLELPEPSVCFHDPGFEIDLLVRADTLALHRVWIGRLAMGEALDQGLIQVNGSPVLASAFPGWLMLGQFAHIESARPFRPQLIAGQ